MRRTPSLGAVPRTWIAPAGLVALASLPLLTAPAWDGYRLALQPHPTLRYFDPLEQPLTVRGLAGAWLVLVAGVWVTLAYRGRAWHWWEAALAAGSMALGLVRLGNVWLAAVLIAPPLASQLSRTRWPGGAYLAAGTLAAVAFAGVLVATRPPPLPDEALRAAQAATGSRGDGVVFASRAWVPHLRRDLPGVAVLGSDDAWFGDPAYWEDYFNISLAWYRWEGLLANRRVTLLVLDPTHEQEALVREVRVASGWHVLLSTPDALVAVRQDT